MEYYRKKIKERSFDDRFFYLEEIDSPFGRVYAVSLYLPQVEDVRVKIFKTLEEAEKTIVESDNRNAIWDPTMEDCFECKKEFPAIWENRGDDNDNGEIYVCFPCIDNAKNLTCFCCGTKTFIWDEGFACLTCRSRDYKCKDNEEE